MVALLAAAISLPAAAAAVGSAGAASLHRPAVVPALAGNGTIEGTVTDAATKAPLDGIEVCAYPLEPETLESAEPSCAITHGTGTYSLSVPAGAYVVEFLSPFESGLNYVPVFQSGYTSWGEAEAHPLTVSAGGTDSGVNAAMHEGGRISGHVASAQAPGGIEGIEACALGIAAGGGFGCATTGAGGDYVIAGLPAGKYIVRFGAPPESTLNYLPQFYEGSSTFGGAKLVTVTLGATTSGIGALLVRGGEIAGVVTAAPGGGPLAGAEVCALTSSTEAYACALTNGKGEYTLRSLAPGTYVVGFAAKGYQWQYYPSGRTFASAQHTGVGAGTYVLLSAVALLPVGYVPPPPAVSTGPPAPPAAPAAGVAGATVRAPAILLSSARLRSSHGHVSVAVSCAGAACGGTLQLTIRVAYRARRHGHAVTLHRTIVLAQGSYSLAAGVHTTIALRETSAGRTHLAHAAHHPLVAQLLGSVTGGPPVTLTVHVS
jgi:hypothetical protein